MIGREVKQHGKCTMPIIRISERAGVSVRTVQYAIAEAKGET